MGLARRSPLMFRTIYTAHVHASALQSCRKPPWPRSTSINRIDVNSHAADIMHTNEHSNAETLSTLIASTAYVPKGELCISEGK